MFLTNRAALAFAALALVAIGFGLRGLLASPSPDPALAARIAALERQAGAPPTGQPAGARAAPAAPAAAPWTNAPPAAAPELARRIPADDGPGSTSPTREDIARVQALRRAELDARFAAEPLDPAWAKVAEQGLLDAAASEEVTMIGEVPAAFASACRSRTCRVQASFAPGDDVDGWLSLYLLGAADNIGQAESMVSMRDDGSFEVTIWGRRP